MHQFCVLLTIQVVAHSWHNTYTHAFQQQTKIYKSITVKLCAQTVICIIDTQTQIQTIFSAHPVRRKGNYATLLSGEGNATSQQANKYTSLIVCTDDCTLYDVYSVVVIAFDITFIYFNVIYF